MKSVQCLDVFLSLPVTNVLEVRVLQSQSSLNELLEIQLLLHCLLLLFLLLIRVEVLFLKQSSHQHSKDRVPKFVYGHFHCISEVPCKQEEGTRQHVVLLTHQYQSVLLCSGLPLGQCEIVKEKLINFLEGCLLFVKPCELVFAIQHYVPKGSLLGFASLPKIITSCFKLILCYCGN